jgi:hypothetical protein
MEQFGISLFVPWLFFLHRFPNQNSFRMFAQLVCHYYSQFSQRTIFHKNFIFLQTAPFSIFKIFPRLFRTKLSSLCCQKKVQFHCEHLIADHRNVSCTITNTVIVYTAAFFIHTLQIETSV